MQIAKTLCFYIVLVFCLKACNGGAPLEFRWEQNMR